ncbi:MAG: hypothetical protein QNJ34_24005 [Xenococcaceae cyanobacterium MO_188.B29]|nr:hypothetical protein [Xenococcaceae cyanobacterium MO_188.B29]
MSVIYHMIPKNFTGNILYPLNQLKKHLPDIYTTQAQKYIGREVLMQCKVPLLNCLWNDVLHCSPLYPSKIRDALLDAGFKWNARPWFAINPVNSGFGAENAVIFLNTPPEDPTAFGNFDFPVTEFIPFSLGRLEKLAEMEVPSATLEYLRFAKNNGERPVLFNYVPHVFYRGAIDVSDVEVVSL